MCVSASAYIKVIVHTHRLGQTRNLLSIYICLIPGKCVYQIGCSRKPFLKQTSFNSNYQMDFRHSRRDGCVCQNNAQQSFITRCSTAEITQLHKTWRNWDFLLDHLGKKPHHYIYSHEKCKILIVTVGAYFTFHSHDVNTVPLKTPMSAAVKPQRIYWGANTTSVGILIHMSSTALSWLYYLVYLTSALNQNTIENFL